MTARILPFVRRCVWFREIPWFCLSCKYTSPWWKGCDRFKYCTVCQARMERLESALRRVDWDEENRKEANQFYQDRQERYRSQRAWMEDYNL